MSHPHTDPLYHIIISEGAKVLVHRRTLDCTRLINYRITRWCSCYWTEGDHGEVSGPWTTLASALRNTPAGELHPGGKHIIFCPACHPEDLGKMMVLVGDGAPREVVINGEDWAPM